MILVVSDTGDVTANTVVPACRRAGLQVLQWDYGQLPAHDRLTISLDAQGVSWLLRIGGEIHDLSTVTTVWLRRPSLSLVHPEVVRGGHTDFARRVSKSIVDSLWATLPARWLPGPPSVATPADDKVLQLVRAVELGFTVPDTWFTNDPDVLVPAWTATGGQLMTKSFDPRDVQRDGELHVPYASRVHRRHLAGRHRLAHAPAILQPAVPKATEVRSMVVGDEVFSTRVDSQASRLTADDWRHYTGFRDDHVPHELPSEVARRCVDLVASFGLASGSIDLILTPEGDYVFLELNVHGEWGWQQASGVPIAEALARWLMASEADPLPRSKGGPGGHGPVTAAHRAAG